MMKVARRTRYHARIVISRFRCERSRFSASPGWPARAARDRARTPGPEGPRRLSRRPAEATTAGPRLARRTGRPARRPAGRRASSIDERLNRGSAQRRSRTMPWHSCRAREPRGPTEAGRPQAPTNPAIRWPAEQHHAAATASGRAAAFPCQGAKQEGEHEPQLPGGARRGALPGAGDTPARANPSCLCPPRCPWPRRAACR